MKLTRNNLNEVLFENQDARLLIEDSAGRLKDMEQSQRSGAE